MPELDDALRLVAAAGATAAQAAEALDAEVLAARAEGATWAQVGAALGVSKQAAQQRFGSVAAERRRQGARTRDEDAAQMRLGDDE